MAVTQYTGGCRGGWEPQRGLSRARDAVNRSERESLVKEMSLGGQGRVRQLDEELCYEKVWSMSVSMAMLSQSLISPIQFS